MSLTSLLARRDVRALLDRHLLDPPRRPVPPLLTPRSGVTPTLVGTANDYALRWRLERYYTHRNTPVVSGPWVAQEMARAILTGRAFAWRAPEAQARLQAGRRAHARFFSGEERQLSAASARALLGLAQLDQVYREGLEAPLTQALDERDVQDLLALQGPVDEALLRARERVVLNPHFGRASRLVGGADADFVLDGTLIDLKTVSRGVIGVEVRRQLLGYLLLWELDGRRLNGDTPVTLNAVGVYLARHRTLISWPLEDLIGPGSLPALAAEFAQLVAAVA